MAHCEQVVGAADELARDAQMGAEPFGALYLFAVRDGLFQQAFLCALLM